MRDIRVSKAKLLETLKKNREAHRKIFLEACDGYRKKAIELLDAELKKAKAGKQFQIYFSLGQPVDQTKDYDRVIGMLELDTEDFILLTETDYRQYVLDDWNWKANFLTSNAFYSKAAADAIAGNPDEYLEQSAGA
jgi:hypothetical protein